MRQRDSEEEHEHALPQRTRWHRQGRKGLGVAEIPSRSLRVLRSFVSPEFFFARCAREFVLHPRARLHAGHPRLPCRIEISQDVDGRNKSGRGIYGFVFTTTARGTRKREVFASRRKPGSTVQRLVRRIGGSRLSPGRRFGESSCFRGALKAVRLGCLTVSWSHRLIVYLVTSLRWTSSRRGCGPLPCCWRRSIRQRSCR